MSSFVILIGIGVDVTPSPKITKDSSSAYTKSKPGCAALMSGFIVLSVPVKVKKF